MKIQFDRNTLLKALVLVILILGIFLGATELVFLVDLGGIDFAVTFLLVYFASIRDILIFKFRVLKSEINEFTHYLSELYAFKPRIFISQASASGVLLALTCSVFLACLLWIPAIYLSLGGIG